MTKLNTETLARAEKEAASSVVMGAKRWVLAAAAALYLVAVFLPFVGDASLWQLLAATEAAKAAQTALTEYLFAWISFIGVAVLTTLAVLTQRFAVAVPAWMVTTVSLVFSVLGIWLRNSNSSGIGRGAGYYLAILAVVIVVFTIFPLILSRNEEQAAVAEQRREIQGKDEVALAQRAATREQGNPLLIDDRRARAAERHRKDSERA
ncbi:hypothetical protein [Corynebacterium sp. HMSC074A01]|uniref:Rv2732c family membrane protein n=1 Tax=Corynebacterium sp. HMSC074A01 TaxID=1715030 RepID=UPI0008A56DCF|nr:hypothetical protein [Corynebacterium sp. HMSC074A01]OHF36613.1 hypothetical protein HMPREF2550_07085 [Corynebacterium sp. HMSC074A01]